MYFRSLDMFLASIMITEQLLQCMVYEYNLQVFEQQKNSNVKEDKDAKKAEKTDKPKRKNMHPHAWMEFFNEPVSLRIVTLIWSVHLLRSSQDIGGNAERVTLFTICYSSTVSLLSILMLCITCCSRAASQIDSIV